jgi:hypothetical protein
MRYIIQDIILSLLSISLKITISLLIIAVVCDVASCMFFDAYHYLGISTIVTFTLFLVGLIIYKD